jgi:lariat debranching enzyme
MESVSKVRVVSVGCLHGSLKDLYTSLKKEEEKGGFKIDIVLCCGDFEVFY